LLIGFLPAAVADALARATLLGFLPAVTGRSAAI
jgi:hypothetical protein